MDSTLSSCCDFLLKLLFLVRTIKDIGGAVREPRASLIVGSLRLGSHLFLNHFLEPSLSRFGSDFNAKMDPKSTPKPTPRRSKNDLETGTRKTEENEANFDPPNLQKSLKTLWFLMNFAISPILHMMPNMTQKWCPNEP